MQQQQKNLKTNLLLFWTGQKDSWPIYLGPIQSEAQIPHLATLLAVPLFPVKGVHGANETGSNEVQRLFARSRNKLFGGYTSHNFITARAWCAITTILQPSTSIYRGLNAVPKVDTPPLFQGIFWNISPPP